MTDKATKFKEAFSIKLYFDFISLCLLKNYHVLFFFFLFEFLGSLEALLDFLKESKIPFAGVKIGPVVKRDVMKASVMLEHEPKYTIILAFDVKIERDAQELADREGVKIFQADIIYHLFDRFTQYQDELKKQKREEFKHVAVFPCKFKVLPNFVFNSRDPIVAGIVVDAGVIRTGTPICVPSKDVSFCKAM